jgi:hypothetical protein
MPAVRPAEGSPADSDGFLSAPSPDGCATVVPGEAGAGAGVGEFEGLDMSVLAERLRKLKEARIFRGPATPADGGGDAVEARSVGPRHRRRAAPTTGPVYAAMAELLAAHCNDGASAAAPVRDAAPAEPAAWAAKAAGPAVAKEACSVAGGGARFHGTLNADGVEGLEPVPAA